MPPNKPKMDSHCLSLLVEQDVLELGPTDSLLDFWNIWTSWNGSQLLLHLKNVLADVFFSLQAIRQELSL